MGAKATPATESELHGMWDEVVGQVVGVAGLALGISLDRPPELGRTAEGE